MNQYKILIYISFVSRSVILHTRPKQHHLLIEPNFSCSLPPTQKWEFYSWQENIALTMIKHYSLLNNFVYFSYMKRNTENMFDFLWKSIAIHKWCVIINLRWRKCLSDIYILFACGFRTGFFNKYKERNWMWWKQKWWWQTQT